MRDFRRRFNLDIGEAEARRRFINRAINLVFERYFGLTSFNSSPVRFMERMTIESEVMSALGERHSPAASFVYIARSFPDCLLAIEALYRALKAWPSEQRYVAEATKRLLTDSEIDLSVKWEDATFRPAGAADLDNALVDEPLHWLQERGYESVYSPFAKALRHYMESQNDPPKLADAITDLYEATEAMAKIVTGRSAKDLSANAELLISRMGASPAFAGILKQYIAYGSEFRHAAQQDAPRALPTRVEVEAYLYLTGLIIRLASSADHGAAYR